ncbi:NADP-dependent oxidoreductase [Parahaliea aestuarii]|uniref:NADP-dependent oxidoreductase n=1 Tax=Parahaliea aestuarii TaxID=1852021 RepID=A0A5C9A4R1_9GAMM|nr:NADP-dependent oxidoreductase [Parahaliea aestuarii]TXS95059.1 NADP-dependent oxidoreductase [Parahaliea aestuarii]
MTTNRELYLHQRPQGIPTGEDIRLREVPAPRPDDGEVLLRNLYLSLDPAQRDWMSDKVSYMPPIAIGEAIRSTTLGEVVSSRHPDYQPGDFALGLAANTWADYSCTAGDLLTKVDQEKAFPLHYHLSIFSGAMGLTPYFGMLELGQPKPGETALISAAAGAVGSIAGQIAKIQGCRVIGLTGSDEKGRWLTDELGFDGYINYRAEADLDSAIATICPEGVDIFFDNVGGEILDAALMNLAKYARVVFCGAISSYNTSGPVPGPFNYWQVLARSATVRGLLTTNYVDRFPAALEDLRRWLDEGRLKFAEDVVVGLESTVDAYRRLFTGANRGKLLVRLTDNDSY